MNIKVLGSGCANCKKLESNVKEALSNLKLDATVEKVEDFKAIMAYGVMQTPALVVDDVVKFYGRVPSAKELEKFL
jgi:small redox-active disulfide protein 2